MASCARCGTFLCGMCIELLGEAAFCARCVALLRKDAVPSRTLRVIVTLNSVTLVSLALLRFPPVPNLLAAVLALWAGTRELRRIRASQGALRGALRAWSTLALGAVNGLLALAWGGILLYLRAHGW